MAEGGGQVRTGCIVADERALSLSRGSTWNICDLCLLKPRRSPTRFPACALRQTISNANLHACSVVSQAGAYVELMDAAMGKLKLSMAEQETAQVRRGASGCYERCIQS